ncbi:MAG: flagellar biosynthetic protein FliP, partial [Pseudomonadota bacterium]|nr:flagellar biosynthetic protein FliP [Pseudomonadota bacterium]
MRKFAWLLLILPLLLLVEPAYAQQGISAVTVTTNQDGSQDYT